MTAAQTAPSGLAPLDVNIWDTVFAGVGFPSALWLNSGHPSLGPGNAAIYAAIADLMPDPGAGVVVGIGDSWMDNATDMGASLDALYGHPITFVDAGISGNRLYQMNDRFDADVAPHAPAYVIHFSGFANDVTDGWNAVGITHQVRRFLEQCWRIGAVPVFLGVAPFVNFPVAAPAMRATVDELLAG